MCDTIGSNRCRCSAGKCDGTQRCADKHALFRKLWSDTAWLWIQLIQSFAWKTTPLIKSAIWARLMENQEDIAAVMQKPHIAEALQSYIRYGMQAINEIQHPNNDANTDAKQDFEKNGFPVDMFGFEGYLNEEFKDYNRKLMEVAVSVFANSEDFIEKIDAFVTRTIHIADILVNLKV